MILVSRSYAHLRAVFEAYKKIAGKDIEDSLKSEMSGDLLNGMLSIGMFQLLNLVRQIFLSDDSINIPVTKLNESRSYMDFKVGCTCISIQS